MFPKQIPIFFKKYSSLSRLKHSWTLPEGYNTSITVFNCVSKQNEPFIVKNKDVVKWYTCGPTVYDSPHIGHASCYVKLDVIQRILKQHFGLNLITCMNITDIDDKIIKKAEEMRTECTEISKQYEKEFWSDLSDLKIVKPDIVLHVTDNIPLIIDFIQKLQDKGVAYKSLDNSVYFDTSKSCHPPGRLQNIGDYSQETHNPYKKSPADFALWKSLKSENELSFNSPWGKGRPGWHIECSTLASHVFGSNIDVHAGGLDLRFPHHENEEIQSCAYHSNHQWVNYWIHTGHLHLANSPKMSKSLKNTISIQEMLKDTKPEVFRLACAMSHYFSPMEYSLELMDTSANLLNVYKNFFINCSDVYKGLLKPSLNSSVLRELLEDSVKDINAAFCNDFNTPQVIETISQMVSKVNSMIHSSATSEFAGDLCYLGAISKLVTSTLNIFGVNINESRISEDQEDFIELIDLLVNFRQDVRNVALKDKNKEILKFCDSLRDNLRKSGLSIKDLGNVSSWSR